ncbi:MAG TPA: DUF6412 domain-containing protein [Streptosporangiaceae bacterium]|jgi:hypothetical protein|nr:DUF6412 domain-containing protein [Streptosporangiaceae bacterium]
MPAIRGGALALIAFAVQVAAALLTGSGGLTILSAAVLAAVLTGLVVAAVASSARIARTVTAAPLRRRAAVLQEKSWSAAFLRQRDPDAAGRPRPRAPAAAPAA